MKTVKLSKKLAQDQMCSENDYELGMYIIDLDIPKELFVMNCNILFGVMMLHFECKERLDRDVTLN